MSSLVAANIVTPPACYGKSVLLQLVSDDANLLASADFALGLNHTSLHCSHSYCLATVALLSCAPSAPLVSTNCTAWGADAICCGSKNCAAIIPTSYQELTCLLQKGTMRNRSNRRAARPFLLEWNAHKKQAARTRAFLYLSSRSANLHLSTTEHWNQP